MSGGTALAAAGRMANVNRILQVEMIGDGF